MNRRLIAVLIIILLFGTQMVFAAADDSEIPGNIRNNRYFLESVKFSNMAEQAFEEGDYDISVRYSEEAVRYAELSDEFVRMQLKIKEADDAIAAARGRLDYAASVGAAGRYAREYVEAQAAYAEARSFRSAEKWDEAIASANKVLASLSYISAEESPPAQPPVAQAPVERTGDGTLPAQYTVQAWNVSKDCFWNIAGRPWVYNDPWKWRTLYNANKSKMPDANNPDLIEPGMVLDIPAIKGETRQGMFDSGKTYKPLP